MLDQSCSASGLSAAGGGSLVRSASSVCMKRARLRWEVARARVRVRVKG